MQNMVDRPASLEDHLLEQLSFCDEEPLIIDFARHIIGNLNSRAFLNGTLAEIKNSYEKLITDDQAERALRLVQHLEPAGVAARDLRECLLLQLEDPEPSM